MISKANIKLINSLSQKKVRDELGLFVIEGTKNICDLCPYFECQKLFATQEWIDQHATISAQEINICTVDEIKKISEVKTSQGVIGIFRKNIPTLPDENELYNHLFLVLDNIQDPGNLGTIIRIADWFGITHIFCSKSTVDVYNSKVVQSTMGAIARIQIHYVNLVDFLSKIKGKTPIYGTFLEGENIYETSLLKKGYIIMGNEGQGISDEVKTFVSNKLLIPNYPLGRQCIESLNVATATAIVCSEFRRRN